MSEGMGGERRRGGVYVQARDPRDVPRLEGLVEGPRLSEGRLHSAKRDGKQKRGTARACRRGWVERMRGGAYVKAAEVLTAVRDASDIPRLEGLVEGPRVVEGTLHSAKRMVSKSEAQHACQRGWVERTRGSAYL